MRKLLLLLLALLLLGTAAAEQTAVLPGSTLLRSYDSETLDFTIEKFDIDGVTCYLTRVQMADPGRQIVKAQAKWRGDIRWPTDIAKLLPVKPMLVINGSGYVSPAYPGIPDDYPGTSKDYFYTPLGSITVTNGELLRKLTGVPYYGLTLQADGLHLHVGEDNDAVLAQNPTETWSFYVKCPLIQNGALILDTDWDWANRTAERNIIFPVGDNTYMDLMVGTHPKTKRGLTLVRATEWIRETFAPDWAYNLDGGPSVSLSCRKTPESALKTVYGNKAKDFDIMAFIELPAGTESN